MAWFENALHGKPVIRACSALQGETLAGPSGLLVAGFMFQLFKKKITAEQMAEAMYAAFIRDNPKQPLTNIDGEVILKPNEQELILLAHLIELLDSRGLARVKPYLFDFFARYGRHAINEKDKSSVIRNATFLTEKIRDYFSSLPGDSAEFATKPWILNKELTPLDKMLILSWYTEHIGAVTDIYLKSLKKFRVI